MRCVIAVGSNLGDREEYIRSAIEKMKEVMEVRAVSTLIETEPVGGPQQGRYLNGVVLGETHMEPEPLMARLLEIEASLGRIRTVANGPRTIDLDLIDHGGIELETDSLTLPHPRAVERAFVLLPWLELDPDATIPGKGSVREIAVRNGWF